MLERVAAQADSSLNTKGARLSVVIPSLLRGQVALDSIRAILALPTTPAEILLVDQTPEHPAAIREQLQVLDRDGQIRWLRLPQPSIPKAMNAGLLAAREATVLFLDDDIVPDQALIAMHLEARNETALVAGQVLQPGEVTVSLVPGQSFRFNSDAPASISEFMGGNFSVNRAKALELGGFDENFVGAAYRFEAEFAHRYVQAFGPIRYEPRALIHHLAVASGGTRAHGNHLRTLQPSHSVGAYYYLLKSRPSGWFSQFLWRPLRAVCTRHHLRRPWWIPLTWIAEVRGMALAIKLLGQGPRLIQTGPQLRDGGSKCA